MGINVSSSYFILLYTDNYIPNQKPQMRRVLSHCPIKLRQTLLSNPDWRCNLNSGRLYSISSRTYDVRVQRTSFRLILTRSQDAITLLNTLQTPRKILEERRKANITVNKIKTEHLKECLALIGHSVRIFGISALNASNLPLAKRLRKVKHYSCSRYEREGKHLFVRGLNLCTISQVT